MGIYTMKYGNASQIGESVFNETSLTEFRHKMRSGDLLAYLYLNGLSIGIVSCFKCYFVQIQPGNLISQKFNSCVTDGPTDGRTDRHTFL